MQILGLFLGMYFDAVVVEVKTFYFYSDWLWPYCAHGTFMFIKKKEEKIQQVYIVMIDLVTKKHWTESYLKNPVAS